MTSIKSSCPWFTNQVEKAIKIINKLYSKWKRTGSIDCWNRYTDARNQASATVKVAKKRYFSRKLNTSLPTKTLWNNIKKLNIYNKETSNCDIDPNNLNEHFLNITKTAFSTFCREILVYIASRKLLAIKTSFQIVLFHQNRFMFVGDMMS